MLWWHFYDLIASRFGLCVSLSLPSMLAWALTLWSVVVCVHDCNIRTIDSRINLCRWLNCIVGCFTYTFSRYKRLRQYVKMWFGSSWYVIVMSRSVWCMAILYACRMFCHPSSLLAILRYLTGLARDAITCFLTFHCPWLISFGWFE